MVGFVKKECHLRIAFYKIYNLEDWGGVQKALIYVPI